MRLFMAGLDVHSAEIAVREALAFSTKQAKAFLTALVQESGVSGAVLLATCNRTELYITAESDISPAELLRAAKSETAVPELLLLEEMAAAQHLMEVACGLHSQILHEEQIVTQIGGALEMARSCHTTDAVLDTLFRTAVSAGKEALTQVAVSAVPLSVSYRAVQRLEQVLGDLREKRCLVIGNGNMGRLAASLLVQKGCQTMVTLRSYHRGETVVPFGTVPVSYEQRFSRMEQADIVISATRSPHYTIWKHQLEQVQHRPAILVDLAMPRDIEASCGTLDGVTLWNLDDLQSDTAPDQQAITALHQIAKQYADTFRMWRNYRDSVPYMQQLKELTAQRILHSTAVDAYQSVPQLEKIVRLTAEKTVDMLMGSMKAQIEPALLQDCCTKIKDRGRF
ncbi:glutamyl-tRNA reductase [uncultured Ruminococcus sp.]|uniref:glutamyl-tRNA reductase n=2 Tax=uncultured Ruminococcus sp. TaxID=165186 RepID=UPI0026741EFD|nr:glutamyl-tRNA reductase [uncultured Ruminococcus sp.]